MLVDGVLPASEPAMPLNDGRNIWPQIAIDVNDDLGIKRGPWHDMRGRWWRRDDTMTQCYILKPSKDKYGQTVMPQTRSKAKAPKRVQVDNNVDNDDSSTSGSSIVRDEIEVGTLFFFSIYSCLILRVGPYQQGSGGRKETKTTS